MLALGALGLFTMISKGLTGGQLSKRGMDSAASLEGSRALATSFSCSAVPIAFSHSACTTQHPDKSNFQMYVSMQSKPIAYPRFLRILK